VPQTPKKNEGFSPFGLDFKAEGKHQRFVF